jgi:hypothetical protein
MGEILGMASTHWPLLIQPDEGHLWPFQMTMNRLKDFPEEKKPISAWPEAARVEFGEDEGVSAHAEHRARLLKSFRVMKAEIEAFNPDFIVMFGDDQYENFKEDIIPPFCVLAYDKIEFTPFKRTRGRPNIWGEPEDKVFKFDGHQEAGRYLARGLLDEGVDMAYAYRPLHEEGLGHAFSNTLLFLDNDREGFDYPVLPVAVNCYGSSVIRMRGGATEYSDVPDPPSPSPRRCFEVGQATARVIKNSPWKVVLMASSSWSHAFLTPKNHLLYPDLEADRALLEHLKTGEFEKWKDYPLSKIEESGQHEVLNWFCLVGAMSELGQKAEILDWAETWMFNAPKCLAVFK